MPDTLEGLVGGTDSYIDILLSSLVDGDSGLLIGGIESLKGPALHALDELVVDEPEERMVLTRTLYTERTRKL